jgi:hypothetical protein
MHLDHKEIGRIYKNLMNELNLKINEKIPRLIKKWSTNTIVTFMVFNIKYNTINKD